MEYFNPLHGVYVIYLETLVLSCIGFYEKALQ